VELRDDKYTTDELLMVDKLVLALEIFIIESKDVRERSNNITD